MNYLHIGAIACGGAIGAVLRVFIANYGVRFFSISFPVGIICVNFFGCIAMGILMGIIQKKGVKITSYPFLISGMLGGFTTYATFIFEAMSLFMSGLIMRGMTYIMISVVGGCFCFLIGYYIAGFLSTG